MPAHTQGCFLCLALYRITLELFLKQLAHGADSIPNWLANTRVRCLALNSDATLQIMSTNLAAVTPYVQSTCRWHLGASSVPNRRCILANCARSGTFFCLGSANAFEWKESCMQAEAQLTCRILGAFSLLWVKIGRLEPCSERESVQEAFLS